MGAVKLPGRRSEALATAERRENTMKKYFANITTAQELKKAYKRLCLQLHPDKGGDPVIKALALRLADVKLWNFNHLDIYDRAPWLI